MFPLCLAKNKAPFSCASQTLCFPFSIQCTESQDFGISISGDSFIWGTGPLSKFSRQLGGRSKFLPESFEPRLFFSVQNNHRTKETLGEGEERASFASLQRAKLSNAVPGTWSLSSVNASSPASNKGCKHHFGFAHRLATILTFCVSVCFGGVWHSAWERRKLFTFLARSRIPVSQHHSVPPGRYCER